MKTIILAGGFGTRLSEETQIKPKPMVEIGEYPIIWHIMKYYFSFGHKEFLVALGYKGHVIKEYFVNYRLHKSDVTVDLKSGNIQYEKNTAEDWTIGLHETGLNSMTGGRLLRLKRLFEPGDTFMLTYGDGVANVDIHTLLEFHRSHGKIATLTAVRPPARFGSVITNADNQIVEFKEKPQIGEGWINGGFFVFNYEIFNYLTDDQTVLEKEPLENLTQDGQLMAFKHYEFWHCMDALRDKNNLNHIWESGKAPWKSW